MIKNLENRKSYGIDYTKIGVGSKIRLRYQRDYLYDWIDGAFVIKPDIEKFSKHRTFLSGTMFEKCGSIVTIEHMIGDSGFFTNDFLSIWSFNDIDEVIEY